MTGIALLQRKATAVLLLAASLLFLHSGSALAQSSTTVSAAGDYLDAFATSELPGAYGDILDYFAKKAENAPDPVKVIYEDLDKYNKWVGRISAGVDILGKAGIGEYSEAAISAAMLGITEYAGSEAGKAMLAVVGLSTVSVNVAVAAVQVYRASVAELEKQTIARQLEALYGRIESDPVLKNRNRTLGQGDPVPVNESSVDYMWKKVMADSGTWRELFKVYVTNELQKEWPEPSTWERWTSSSDLLEEDLLLKNRAEYKSYIAGLLSHLNRLAKAEEQQVLARQALYELQRKAGPLPDLGTMLQKFNEARKRLPAATELGTKCATYVQNAINTKSINSLEDLMSQCKGFAENVLRYIPEKGTYAAERKRILDQLKKCYELAKSNVPTVATLQKQDLEKKAQSVPAASGGYRFEAQRFPYTVEFSQVKDQVLAAFQKGQAELDKLIDGMNKEYYDKSESKYQDLASKTYTLYRRTGWASTGQSLLEGTAMDALNAAYGEFTEKLNAYRGIDSTAFSGLMSQVNEYVDTLARAARLDAEKTNPRPVWDKINVANTKKETVLQAITAVEKIPADAGYAGLLKLTFPKPGPSQYGAKSYLMPYLEYVNRLALNVRYRVTYYEGGSYSYGGEGRIGEINAIIQQIDATTALIDDAGKLNADVKGIEESIANLRNALKTATLRQEDRARLDKELLGMDASVKELKDFLGKTSGYKSMCNSKKTKYLTDINNIETDILYLTQLKMMLERTGDILDGLYARYRSESAGSYGVGTGGFIFKENTGTGCEALLTKPSIMSKAEMDKAASGIIAEVEKTGIFKTDRIYNMGIEQRTRKAATDYFASGTLSPEHYIFLQIPGGQCLFYTKDHFEDLANKINALPVESSDTALKIRLDGIATDSMVARFLVGLNPGNALDKINTKALLDVADRSWDGDVKQSIRKFVSAVNGKVDAFRHYAVVETQMSALLTKLMAVESPAQGKTDAALWKKVTEMEPEILAFEKSVAADSLLTAENKNSLKISVDSMKNRISMAKSQIQIIEKGPQSPMGMGPMAGGGQGMAGQMPVPGGGQMMTGQTGGMPVPGGGAMSGTGGGQAVPGQTGGAAAGPGGTTPGAQGAMPGNMPAGAGMGQAGTGQMPGPGGMPGIGQMGQGGTDRPSGPGAMAMAAGTEQMPSAALAAMPGQPTGPSMPTGQQTAGSMPQMAGGSAPQGGAVQPPAGRPQIPAPQTSGPASPAGAPQASGQSGAPTMATQGMPQMTGGQTPGQQGGQGPIAGGQQMASMAPVPSGMGQQGPSGQPSRGTPTMPAGQSSGQPAGQGPMAGMPQMAAGLSQVPAPQTSGQTGGGIGSMTGGALSQGIQGTKQGIGGAGSLPGGTGGTMQPFSGGPSSPQQTSGTMAGAGSTPAAQAPPAMKMVSATAPSGTPSSQAPQAGGTRTVAMMPSSVERPQAAAQAVDYTGKVKDLYAEFGRAFNGKDIGGVTGCLSRDWQANDGTSLSALKTGLEKAFKTFDEVKLNVQNLKIEKGADGKYKATYSATVSGLIKKTNTKPEERSNVSDEIAIDQTGKPKIAKTLAGRFWLK